MYLDTENIFDVKLISIVIQIIKKDKYFINNFNKITIFCKIRYRNSVKIICSHNLINIQIKFYVTSGY